MEKLEVGLKRVVDDSYEIKIGFGLENDLIEYIKKDWKNISKVVILTDDIVEGLYARRIESKMTEAGLMVSCITIPHGEKNKTRQMKEYIEDTMLSKGCKRDTLLVNVGGGMVSDIGGFVAGTFMRGIPYINYSTTFLSAADASIGGKTAVDTDYATNMIGLFYQPKRVFIDASTWRSLPRREFVAGIAETIKHGIICDEEFFSYLEEHIRELLDYDKCEKSEEIRNVLLHVARRNCEIKYSIVMKDEKEEGIREILNLGHTVGRAIEALSNYELLHGEAVSIGIAYQAELSEKQGYSSLEEEKRVINLLEKAGLPTKIPTNIDGDELERMLNTDKKIRNGKIRFVLQKGIGDTVIYTK